MKRGVTFGTGPEDVYGLAVARAGMLNGFLESLDEPARRTMRHDLFGTFAPSAIFFEVPVVAGEAFPIKAGFAFGSNADAIRFEFTVAEVRHAFAALFGAMT